MKNQTFGIEIEMTGISRETAAKTVSECFEDSRIQYEGGCYDTRNVIAADGRKWKIVRDSSIRCENGYNNEVEFVSPICKWEDIEKVQEIVRALRKAGAKVNDSCGMHVHVGADGHTAESIRKLAKIMTRIEPDLFKIFEVKEDRLTRWCKPIDITFVNRILSRNVNDMDDVRSQWYANGGDWTNHYDQSRYHALNLHSIWQKAHDGHLGTIEFRLFNSTLHAGEVKTAIQIAMAISARALSAKTMTIKTNRHNESAAAKMRRLVKMLDISGEEFKTARIIMARAMKKTAAIAA